MIKSNCVSVAVSQKRFYNWFQWTSNYKPGQNFEATVSGIRQQTVHDRDP